MMKRILSLLLALSVLLLLPMAALAHDVPQQRDDCSIEVVVRYEGEDVSGGTLTVIRVGFVAEDDGNYFFAQEMTGLKIETLDSPEAAAQQQEFYSNNKDNYTFYTQTQSVVNGKATFSGLSTGLYLVLQEKAAEGFNKMGAFLVSVPYMLDGEYQYHVTVSMKSALEREPDPTEPPPTVPDDPELPETGQLNWPIPLMVVAGLLLLTLGWVLCFKKKREQYAK